MTSGPLPLPPKILLAEDNPGDQLLTRRALGRSGVPHDLYVIEDGAEVLEFLGRRGRHLQAPRPDIILLDLNLPKLSGFEVLDRIKADPDLRLIPVIVLTSSEADRDIVGSLSRYANSYMVKPGSPSEFDSSISALSHYWLLHSKLHTR